MPHHSLASHRSKTILAIHDFIVMALGAYCAAMFTAVINPVISTWNT